MVSGCLSIERARNFWDVLSVLWILCTSCNLVVVSKVSTVSIFWHVVKQLYKARWKDSMKLLNKKTRKFKVYRTYVAENDVAACGVNFDLRGI